MKILTTAGLHKRYFISDARGYWDGKSWDKEQKMLYYSHEEAAKVVRNIELVSGVGKPSKRYKASITLDVVGDLDKDDLIRYLFDKAKLTLSAPSPNDSKTLIQIDWATLEEEKDESCRDGTSASN
jgi:hypothetical protein